MGKAKWMNEMSWKEFADLLRETDIAIIPVGVLEAHGLHAPLGSDTYIAEEIAKRLAQKINAILLPPIHYGCLKVMYDATMWPGGISVSAETLVNLYTEIGNELARQGVKRIIFVNAHWCHQPILDMVVPRIRADSGAATGILAWWVAASPELKEMEAESDHAGKIETSILLATDARAHINMEKAVANPPPSPPKLSPAEFNVRKLGLHLIREFDKRYLGDSANYGDPKKADVKIGEKLISAAVTRGAELAEALRSYVKS
jgi:creatinine amidohydrolase